MYTDTDRYHDITSAFREAGYITGEGRVIKRGKEASVLCCPAHPSLGVESVALKLYKDQQFRNFRNDAAYLGGRVWKRRDVGHLRAVKDHVWVETEFRVLDELHAAGIRVPRPYTQIAHGIVMEYVRDGGTDAPLLKDVRLEPDEALRVYHEILDAIRAMLGCRIIHGDLSPFNILYDGRHPVLIDFPQAIHARRHPDPYPVFRRDVENIRAWFTRCVTPGSGSGPSPSAEADANLRPHPDDADLARELWVRAIGEPEPLAPVDRDR